MRALRLVGLSILIATSNVAMAQFSGIFGPSNYDECVLENMKGVTSDVAAARIDDSCAHKFPRKAPEPDAKRDTPLDLGLIGWEVSADGIGHCYMAWDGARFVETARREKHTEENMVKAVSPTKITLNLFVPKRLVDDNHLESDAQILQLIGQMFGGTLPTRACTKLL
jgi:hypothetical protein